MAVSHRLFRLHSPAAKNTLSSFLIRSRSSSSSGPTLDPEIDLEEATAQLEKSSSPSPSKGRNFHWVFLGCPGVGKGTYASRLSSLLSVPHIATGDLVREELSSSGLLSSQVRFFFWGFPWVVLFNPREKFFNWRLNLRSCAILFFVS